jgi:hypothetical protein
MANHQPMQSPDMSEGSLSPIILIKKSYAAVGIALFQSETHLELPGWTLLTAGTFSFAMGG